MDKRMWTRDNLARPAALHPLLSTLRTAEPDWEPWLTYFLTTLQPSTIMCMRLRAPAG